MQNSPTSSTARLTPVAEALAPLLALAKQVEPVSVPMDEAGGLVAAEDLYSPGDIPSRPVALRAGYAVASAMTVGAAPYSPLPLARRPQRVRAGDELADDADAVAPVDAVSGKGALCELAEEVFAGQDARLAGQDLAAGSLIVAAGEVVTATHVLALKLSGATSVRVARPRISLMRGTAGAAEYGWLQSFIASLGCVIREGREAGGEADLAIAVDEGGGAQSQLLHHARWRISGIALRPGESAGCVVTQDGTPCVILPARFDGLIGATLALVLPLIAGMQKRILSFESRRLSRKASSAIGATELVLLDLIDDMVEPVAVGDVSLQSLLRAKVFFFAPPESEGFAAGAMVEAASLRQPLTRELR